ncbi:hypothetical protein Poli38472_010659 [Pythium oligandrum]|uniref:Uncharacterized protein n=1 Tax=Pythium oligandrum TaxID=41045 RepID=A0A8K1C3H7_PYTOL|nr:hypothetical protein Poli38472_010659 [Pythium oligandrum]|eukprot:TMW55777.1 hypothetical protein Poli38472_010659 [Pythium oligandrum]
MEAVGFKKKAKKNANGARKRARLAEEDGAEQEGDVLQTIEEVLEDQRLRTQLLRSEPSSKADAKVTSKPEPAAEVQYGLHDPKKDGSAGQKLLHMLDGQFTGQTGTTQRDQHEELMNKYIEERLKKKTKTEETPSPTDAPPVTEVDALYADLRKKVVSAATPNDASDGGVLIWNTGIAEVELPSSYHEKTFRETQKALIREQASASASKGVESSALPTNFSTDFNRHRSEFVSELKSLSKEEQRERGFVNVKKDQPSDNLAVSRFRKHESRKHR